jgi:hypothetical protein
VKTVEKAMKIVEKVMKIAEYNGDVSNIRPIELTLLFGFGLKPSNLLHFKHGRLKNCINRYIATV